MGIKCVGVKSNFAQRFGVEHDPCVGFKALPDHPSKWNPGKRIPRSVWNGTATYIYNV